MSNYENRVQKDLLTDAVFCESAEDFILPEYMPEVGRVLRITSSLLPDEGYLGADSAEFSGAIEYRLLYCDGEGTVAEAPLEGRYRYRVPLGEGNGAFTYTEERIESVSVRPSAPRKLGIRTRICAHPHVMADVTMGTDVSRLAPGETCELLTDEREISRRQVIRSGALRCEGRFLLEDTDADRLRLLSARAALLPEYAAAHDGYLSVRGRIVCTCLFGSEDGEPILKSYTLPFEEELTAEDAHAEDIATLRGFCPTPVISFEESGADTAVLLDAEYTLEAMLYRNEPLSVLCDFYAHGASYAVKTQPFTGKSLLGCFVGNVTVSGELPVPGELGIKTGVLLPAFNVKESTVSLLTDRAVIEGMLDVSLLVTAGKGGERTELSLPFRVEVPFGCALADDDEITYSLTPIGGTATVGGAGVRLFTELAVSAAAHRPFSVSIPVEAVKTEQKKEESGSTIRVYYPTDEDSLWSVGKRYGIPLATLKKQNGIPEDGDTADNLTKSLDGYAYLLLGEL